MIKKTFYNLSEEKRNRVIDAILHEFSNATTDRVSINRIIKEANISRGSFYQYFDDKMDLVEILMSVFKEKTQESIDKVLNDDNNNIFAIYENLFYLLKDLADDEKYYSLLRSFFSNVESNKNLITQYLISSQQNENFDKNLKMNIYSDGLKYKTEYEVQCLRELLSQMLKTALIEIFFDGKNIKQVEDKFICQINIVKSGALEKE